jgi:hypothetical protein
LYSSLASYEAEKNFEAEFLKRIETTPFHALTLLGSSLTDGTTTFKFNHRDAWTDWNNNERVNSSAANITLQSDVKNLNFALNGDIETNGDKFDFAAYLNRNRLALGSSLIGSDNYGVDFSTIVQDIVSLAGMAGEFGISADDIDEAVEVFNQVTSWFGDSASSFDFGAYARIFTDFMLDSESVTENVDFDSGASVRRVTYDFSEAAYFNLYRDMLNVFENDNFIVSLFDSPFFAVNLGVSRSDVMGVIRDAIREMEREMGMGTFIISYYIDGSERLLRMVIDLTSDEMNMNMVLCLGDSAEDTWKLDMDLNDGWNDFTMNIVWDIRESDGTHTHVFDMAVSDGNWMDEAATAEIAWNPSTGRFTVSAAERGDRMEEVLNGNFTVNGDTFRLTFEHSESGSDWSNEFSLELSTSRGTNIGNVEYKNLLTMSFVDLFNLSQAISSIGGNSWDDSWDYDDSWDDYDWGDIDWGDFDWDSIDWGDIEW